MNGDIFPESVVVANFGARQAALPFQILRFEPDAGEGEDFVAPPQLRMALNDHMRMQPAAAPQHHVLPNHAIRPEVALGADLRPGMDDGRRMDHGI